MCKKKNNDFTLKNCVYLDYDLYSMQLNTHQCTSQTGWLGALQVIVKSNWQHTSLDEAMKSSQLEFYAHASFSSQVLCRKHNIYMYLGEYSTKLWLFVK